MSKGGQTSIKSKLKIVAKFGGVVGVVGKPLASQI
jgi:hypothetical protein